MPLPLLIVPLVAAATTTSSGGAGVVVATVTTIFAIFSGYWYGSGSSDDKKKSDAYEKRIDELLQLIAKLRNELQEQLNSVKHNLDATNTNFQVSAQMTNNAVAT